ncbi:MAG: 4Fe-4S dicluster domain-containing protein, partial [Planctomycetes bacterium]|nr:4Fe-4S dicluster domain-containing protein [Planctomycetota bacterium]
MAYHRIVALRRYGTFTGGIDLPEEKHATLGQAVEALPPPRRLLVPLAPHGGAPAEPIVPPGSRVEADERIAAGRAGGVDIFAPLAGRVAGTTSVRAAVGHDFIESPALELTDLQQPGDRRDYLDGGGGQANGGQAGGGDDWRGLAGDELIEHIARGGLVIHRQSPGVLSDWLVRARRAGCRMLVANVLEQEPYVTADHRVLAERGEQVVEGLAILARAAGAARAVVAADRRRTGFYDSAAAAARRLGVALVALPHKYPMGADTILAKVLTRRETPPARSTLAVGVGVLDAATCLAAWRWVVLGRPATARVVTLAGELAKRPRNVLVPFGTPCGELLDAGEGLLVHGGAMTGSLCDERAVATPATRALLALPRIEPIPSQCIRCGWCTDHCPARLNVSALNDAFELSLLARARALQVGACIECGVCSYVCPARLPLAQRVRQLKAVVQAYPPGRPAGRI